jgi:hypothetical protein
MRYVFRIVYVALWDTYIAANDMEELVGSIAKINRYRWPWPRTHYVELIHRVAVARNLPGNITYLPMRSNSSHCYVQLM